MNPIFNVRKTVNFDPKLCFICQKRRRNGGKQASLATANENSIDKLIKAAEQRKNLGEINDIFDRIDTYLKNGSTITVKWHTIHCYGPFTQSEKIQRLAVPVASEKPDNSQIKETINLEYEGTITRSKIPSFSWDLCAFCQIDSKKPYLL